jgi:single-stranded DNA-binding protein
MKYVNEITLRGTLARDPKTGSGQNGRYAFATLITKDGKNSYYHDIAAFEREMVDILSSSRKDDELEIHGKLTYRKQDDHYKASIIIDECFEPGGSPTRITDDDIPF